MKCRKCGGSGDVFIYNKGKEERIENFSWGQINNTWNRRRDLCCSLCNGLGVEDE